MPMPGTSYISCLVCNWDSRRHSESFEPIPTLSFGGILLVGKFYKKNSISDAQTLQNSKTHIPQLWTCWNFGLLESVWYPRPKGQYDVGSGLKPRARPHTLPRRRDQDNPICGVVARPTSWLTKGFSRPRMSQAGCQHPNGTMMGRRKRSSHSRAKGARRSHVA